MEAIILAVVWAVLTALFQALKQRSETASSEEAGSTKTFPDPEEAIKALRSEGEALARELKQLPRHGQVLVEVLTERVLPDVDEAEEDFEEARSLEGLQTLTLVHLRIGVLRYLAQTRREQAQQALFADAETLAETFIEPFRALARTEAFAFARYRPICVPAVPNHESIWMGLLPAGYPVVFVPSDFGENLYRWASLPHEMGHLIYRRVPGFADEVRDRLGLHFSGQVLRIDKGASVQLLEPFSAWQEELVADAFTLLMMGPAGLRGLIECFQMPSQPAGVAWATASEGYYDEHPPVHLRVAIGARLLHHVGFDVEANALLEDWNERHGRPDKIFLPTDPSGAVAIPAEVMVGIGSELMQGFYNGAYESLTGRELRSIHGLELSPGNWAKAQEQVSYLSTGQAVRTDPRVVLVGAIEAYARNPTAKAQIALAVERSILGRDTDERRQPDKHYALKKSRSAPVAGGMLADVRAALVLREVLRRNGGRRPGLSR